MADDLSERLALTLHSSMGATWFSSATPVLASEMRPARELETEDVSPERQRQAATVMPVWSAARW